MTPPHVVRTLEIAELERWYDLPPREAAPLLPADTSAPALFGLCLACALLALIAQAPHGGTY